MRLIYFKLLLITLSSAALGQKADEKNEQAWPLMAAFSFHSYSWPVVKSFVTPMQPGFKIGTEYQYSSRRNHMILQTFNLGYFHNPDFLDACYLNTFFTFRYKTTFGLFADAAIGAGYIHRRHSREVFRLNDNGEYESMTDWGSPAGQLGLNLGLGYCVKVSDKQLNLFVNYEWFVVHPHVKDDIPVLPHSLYHIGLRYYLFN
jgi:hypothetical protein